MINTTNGLSEKPQIFLGASEIFVNGRLFLTFTLNYLALHRTHLHNDLINSIILH